MLFAASAFESFSSIFLGEKPPTIIGLPKPSVSASPPAAAPVSNASSATCAVCTDVFLSCAGISVPASSAAFFRRFFFSLFSPSEKSSSCSAPFLPEARSSSCIYPSIFFCLALTLPLCASGIGIYPCMLSAAYPAAGPAAAKPAPSYSGSWTSGYET